MPKFTRYIGVDYSGARTPTASLKGLRVYLAEGDVPPAEVLPPSSSRKYWTRRGIAEWLIETDRGHTYTGRHRSRLLVSAALFRGSRLLPDWPSFLDDFSIAAWLSRADRDGSFAAFRNPSLPERTLAQVEGWILGVPGLIRAGKVRHGLGASAACDPCLYRLH
jgi:hypothetical protein